MIFMNETNLSLKYLIDQLHKEQTLTKEEWITLIEGHTPELSEYLFSLAREERHRYYGHDVYVRGLIEFTNYCRNVCYYCGIRRSNNNVSRYRLTKEEILTILSKTENGVESIVSSKNRYAKALNCDIDELSVSEVIDLIQDNPRILKSPILIDDKRLQVGYKEDDIRAFLPRSIRNVENSQARMRAAL